MLDLSLGVVVHVIAMLVKPSTTQGLNSLEHDVFYIININRQSPSLGPGPRCLFEVNWYRRLALPQERST